MARVGAAAGEALLVDGRAGPASVDAWRGRLDGQVGLLVHGRRWQSSLRAWERGVDGMHVGEIRQIKVPAAEGYGAKGFRSWRVPPNADLIFEIELLAVAGAGSEDDESSTTFAPTGHWRPVATGAPRPALSDLPLGQSASDRAAAAAAARLREQNALRARALPAAGASRRAAVAPEALVSSHHPSTRERIFREHYREAHDAGPERSRVRGWAY